MSGRLSLAATVLGLAAFLGLFAWLQLRDPALPAGSAIGPSDLETYFYPSLVFLRDALRDGELPLWNPYQMAGAPFLAMHQPGAAYPPLLLLTWLPPTTALTVHALGHLFLAGIFTALFVRQLGVGGVGALAAALTFAGSGPLLGGVQNPAYLATYTWLPACLWAGDLLVQRRSLRSAVLLAGMLALSFLGGFSQAFVYTVQALGLFALFRVATRLRRGQRAQALALLAAAGVLAIGLVGVQLLPSLEHTSEAVRSGEGMSLAAAQSAYRLQESLGEILTGQAPLPLGLPALFLPLAFAALASARLRPEALFFAALLLLSFDFARSDGFVFPLYFELPLGDWFRIPMRIDFLFQQCAAVLVGIGADALLRALGDRRPVAACAALGTVAFLAWDLHLRNAPSMRFAPLVAAEELDGPDEAVRYGADAGGDRIFLEHPDIPAKLGTIHGLFVVPDYEPLLPRRYLAFFGGRPGSLWHGALTLKLRRLEGLPRQELELLDLLSVRHYVSTPTRPHRLAELPVVREGDPQIRLREEALPRAYLVHELLRAANEEEALRIVRELRFDPRRQAVVWSDLAPLGPRIPGAPEHARIETTTRNRVQIRADCASPCLLVLTDLFAPGWQATLDGEPVEVVAANYLFRGVRLPPGSHRVDFEYRPRGFYRGAALSAASVAAAMLLLVLPSLARRRRPAAPPTTTAVASGRGLW